MTLEELKNKVLAAEIAFDEGGGDPPLARRLLEAQVELFEAEQEDSSQHTA